MAWNSRLLAYAKWLLIAALSLPVAQDYGGSEGATTNMQSFFEALAQSYEDGDSDGQAARTVIQTFRDSPDARAEFVSMIDQYLATPGAVDSDLIFHGCRLLSYYDVDVSSLVEHLFRLCRAPQADMVIQTDAVYTLAKYSASRADLRIAQRIYEELPIHLQGTATEAILRNYRCSSSRDYIMFVIRVSLASMSQNESVKIRESLFSSFSMLPHVGDVSLEDIDRMFNAPHERLIMYLSLLPARQVLDDRAAKGMIYQLACHDELCRWYYAEYLEFYID